MEIKIFDREGLSLTEKNSLEILDEKTKFYEELIVKAKENKNILCKTDFYSEEGIKHFLDLVFHKNKKDEIEKNIEKILIKHLSDFCPVIYKRNYFSKQLSFVTLTKREFKNFLKLFFIEGEIVKISLENLEALFGKIFFTPELNLLSYVLKEIKSKDFKESEKNRERFLKVDKIYMKEPLTKNAKDFMLEHMDSLTDFPRNISNHVLKIKLEEIETFDMVEKPYMELF